jgi:nitrogen regulatory protein P-II 1
MKEIRAIVRPSRVQRLRDALRGIPNFPGVTLMKAEGFTAPASMDARSIRDKVMLSVLCEDSLVPAIREAIFQSCRTGQVGDGLVWVVDIAEIHRVRDGSVY